MRFKRQLLFRPFLYRTGRPILWISAIFMLSLLVFALPCFAQEGLQDKTITLDVENMNIEMVLKMIAEQSGLNIVISKSVVGEITVKLDKVNIYQALDSVLKTNNYVFSIENDIISVYSYQDSQQQERFTNLQTKVFSLTYTDVADLNRILLSMKSPRGIIEINEKNN
ncbi:MAG: hypothetical protein Q8O36_03825, partial [Candidatus Omnitrophota bacterium]|nr:hypothetical protein [Candidatus Omnitrophota bacterium]